MKSGSVWLLFAVHVEPSDEIQYTSLVFGARLIAGTSTRVRSHSWSTTTRSVSGSTSPAPPASMRSRTSTCAGSCGWSTTVFVTPSLLSIDISSGPAAESSTMRAGGFDTGRTGSLPDAANVHIGAGSGTMSSVSIE